MAYTSGANDAFNAGQFHAVNDQHGNAFSITLGDAAGSADQGLADTSERWDAEAGTGYTPHSVLAGLPGMSGNGMSSADAGRVLPGGRQLMSPDGTSQSSYGQASTLQAIYGTD